MLKKFIQRGRRQRQHRRRTDISPARPKPAMTGSFPRYVEDVDETRTKLREGARLGALGQAGGIETFFSILVTLCD